MDFVGDYQTKKKLAEALRARQTAMQTAGSQIDTGPIVTQGQGAFPGQVQANWAAPLAQMGAAYFANKAGKKADVAETESAEARRQALQEMIGGDNSQGFLTPENVLQMSELGVEPGMAKLLKQERPAAGAIAQAAQTPAGIRSLVNMKIWTPEQGEQALSALQTDQASSQEAERQKYLFEEQNKRFAPQQGRAPNEFEFAMQYPDQYAKMQEAKAAARQGAASNPYEKKVAEEQAKVDVKLSEGESKLKAAAQRADTLIADYTAKPYTKGNSLRLRDDAASVVGLPKPSDYDQDVQKQNQAIKQFHLDAMEQMRGFGQVTENEQAIIGATQFDIYDGPEARIHKLNTVKDAVKRGLEKVALAKERMKAGTAVLGKGKSATDDLDAEMDALMGGQ